MLKPYPVVLAVAAAVSLAACAATATDTRASRSGTQVSAILRAADGSGRGRVTATAMRDTTRITVAAWNLTPGSHGIHIHAVGRCDAPGFTSAGPHWNPEAKLHGRDNPAGAHRGDLPNLTVGADGRATTSFDVPTTTAALLEGEGKAIIIHADTDDYRSDPGGNSGARVVCGVFAAG